ncbi:MAG: L-serine ammonia-lyase, iron-sulfur-dependent, subunit alpha [Peptococcales bacterium]|jgi:L-serine dehydratase
MHGNDYSVFDIMGPIMIGPSSSHTCGPVRIGLLAGQLCDYQPKTIHISMHGVLACTYTAHKTDAALIAGMLGLKIDDEQIPNALCLARNKGIKVTFEKTVLQNAHPNTVVIKFTDQVDKKFEIRACTIGGGNIILEEINGYKVDLDGKGNYLIAILRNEEEKMFKEKIIELLGKDMLNYSYYRTNHLFVYKIETTNKLNINTLKKIQSFTFKKEVYMINGIIPSTNKNIHFFNSVQELVETSQKNNCLISDTVLRYESLKSNSNTTMVFKEMENIYDIMEVAIFKGIEKENKLLGNLFANNAKKINNFQNESKSLCGSGMSKVIRNALAVMEVNSSMGKIAACPTAGSCGTIPAALTVCKEKGITKNKIVQAFFTGAGIGMVIAKNASISGGISGCQAEIGSASAMAAAILTEVFGGDYAQIDSAVALTLGNMLGLVCDPAAGMVEIPCIQRNTIAALNAICCAEMALAGVNSIIPADEMIGAMKEVGRIMPPSLKCTLEAGISNTPTARKIEQSLGKFANNYS